MKNVLQALNLLLSPDKEHKKVFANAPIVEFHNSRNLKDSLVTAALRKTNKTWKYKLYGKKNCLVCNSISTNINLKKDTCREVF